MRHTADASKLQAQQQATRQTNAVVNHTARNAIGALWQLCIHGYAVCTACACWTHIVYRLSRILKIEAVYTCARCDMSEQLS